MQTVREIVLSEPMHYFVLLDVGTCRGIDDNVSKLLPISSLAEKEVRPRSLSSVLPDNIDSTGSNFGIMMAHGKAGSKRSIDAEDDRFTFRR